MTTYVGRWNGVTESGEIFRHEVREFVESCQAAGWTSVAVAEGPTILGAFRDGRVWFKEESAA